LKHLLQNIKDQNIKKGLRLSIFEGVLWALMFGSSENYIVPFALLFGASVFQVSLLQGFGQLGIGLSQLFGSFLVHHTGHRKGLSLLGNTFHAFSWLFVFFVTLFTGQVWFVILFFGLGLTFTNLGGPGWISWMNDLVPRDARGRFWGMRNRILGLAQFVTILAAGLSLFWAQQWHAELVTYGVLFSFGFLARFSGVFLLKKQYEPPAHVPAEKSRMKFRKFIPRLVTTNFGRFVFFVIVMTFSINLMAPLIPVYLLKELGFNYLQFTILIMTSTIFTFIFMTYWGPLSDKYGNYRILTVTALVMPLLPFAWIFIRNFYLLIPLQVFSGFIWAGFNLSVLNYIFDAVARENISKITGYYTFLNTSCAFLGSLCGGLIAALLVEWRVSFLFLNPFTMVFAVSFILRVAVLMIFRNKFKEIRQVEVSPGLRYFYIYRPATNVINRFLVLRARFRR
jgi:MFS family permease